MINENDGNVEKINQDQNQDEESSNSNNTEEEDVDDETVARFNIMLAFWRPQSDEEKVSRRYDSTQRQ